jgi:cytoskeletal protein CcmA (bactofilin family)
MLGFGGKIETVIGEGAEFKGNIHVPGAIFVNGRVHGPVRSDELITLGEKGEVEGDLVAPLVVVAGRLRGNIEAGAKVDLMATASVAGEIRTPKILIAEGAMFEGNCEMVKPENLTVDFKSAHRK